MDKAPLYGFIVDPYSEHVPAIGCSIEAALPILEIELSVVLLFHLSIVVGGGA